MSGRPLWLWFQKGDGCLGVCGDYKQTINPVLVVDQYLLPRVEDLMSQLSGGQKFLMILT